jgi:hypothetical protein
MFNNILKGSDELTDQDAEFSENELVPCFKRIRKSIRRWTKVGGRQGYLTYIVPDRKIRKG